MGMPSLAVEYATRNTTLFLESLQDKGRLGSHTRTHGEATARPEEEGALQQTRGTRATPRVRQHAITRAAGLCIKINDHTKYDLYNGTGNDQGIDPWGANDTRTVPLKFMVPS
jgi:hypothetical protein